MELVVDLTTKEVVLRDEDDLKRFAVLAVPSAGDNDAADPLGLLAEVLGVNHAGSVAAAGDVLVPPETLRDLAARSASGHGAELDVGWEAEFASMLDFAAARGWIEDGMVRAHVEWVS